MKKKSTSQSAFFNLRVLIGLFVALTGVSLLALSQFATAANPFRLGVGASSHARTSQAQPQYKVTTKSQYISPLVPPGFDCSKIRQFGIDRMENFRAGAIMIHCGQAKGGGGPHFGRSCVLKACSKPDGATGVWQHGRGFGYWH